MAPLTYPELRHLARLYRDDVGGAAEQLMDVVRDRNDELPELLGFPMMNLDRLLASTDPVEMLVATIEAAPRAWRQQHADAQRAAAFTLAENVATTARRDRDRVVLDVSAVAQMLAAWPGGGVVAFGAIGSSDVGTLRALLRECRRVRGISAVIHGHRLVVTYETKQSTGRVALVLRPVVRQDDMLVVPLEVDAHHPLVEIPNVTAACAVSDDAVRPPEVPQPRIHAQRPQRPFTGFLGHLVAAAVEALAAR